MGRIMKSPEPVKKEKMVDVPFSEAEVILLHAVASLGDGRTAMVNLIRKRVSPVAMAILKQKHRRGVE